MNSINARILVETVSAMDRAMDENQRGEPTHGGYMRLLEARSKLVVALEQINLPVLVENAK